MSFDDLLRKDRPNKMLPITPRTGGLLKPDSGLSGAVLVLDRVFPPLFCILVSSIPTRFSRVPHSRVTSQHQVPPLRRPSLSR